MAFNILHLSACLIYEDCCFLLQKILQLCYVNVVCVSNLNFQVSAMTSNNNILSILHSSSLKVFKIVF